MMVNINYLKDLKNLDNKIPRIKPSLKIGIILDCLLAEVIQDPKLNNKDYLENKSKELNKLNSDDLRKKAKEVIEEKREKDNNEMKKGYFVK